MKELVWAAVLVGRSPIRVLEKTRKGGALVTVSSIIQGSVG